MEREKLNEQEFNTVMAGGKLAPREGDEPKAEQPAAPVESAPVAETAEPAESAEQAEPAEPAQIGEEFLPEQDAPKSEE